MTVQTFVTLAFILSFASQVIIAMQMCRWPLEFVLQYEWMLSAFNFMANAASCKYSINLHLTIIAFCHYVTSKDDKNNYNSVQII